MGGLVDLIIVSKDRVDQSKFNLDRHRTIVPYKAVICSLDFPVALALLFCGFPVEKKNESEPDYYELAFDILSPLGEYFQIEGGHLNFSRSLSYSGRSATEMDNRCSWCINTALKYANSTSRAILDADYG